MIESGTMYDALTKFIRKEGMQRLLENLLAAVEDVSEQDKDKEYVKALRRNLERTLKTYKGRHGGCNE